uniref:Uncharacterized protein n=1 Tax=Octopus bimaculoides TaxID=37653 RepID=A0A0L8GR50_OCTBM
MLIIMKLLFTVGDRFKFKKTHDSIMHNIYISPDCYNHEIFISFRLRYRVCVCLRERERKIKYIFNCICYGFKSSISGLLC